MIGIYSILNLFSNKRYIGKAFVLKNRWNSHRSLLRRNIHPSRHLQSAWNKYGEVAFKFEVIEEVSDKTKLIEKEQYWIDHYKSYERDKGYNSRLKAENNEGWHQSKETKQQISRKMKAYNFSQSHKRNISLSKIGKKIEKLCKPKINLICKMCRIIFLVSPGNKHRKFCGISCSILNTNNLNRQLVQMGMHHLLKSNRIEKKDI